MVKSEASLRYIIIFITTSLTYLADNSNGYMNYSIENYQICSPTDRKGKIELLRDNKSAAFVREIHYFDNWRGFREFSCKFEVEAKSRHGVFAVIQSLSLRQNKTTKECIDYVQFTPERGPKGPRICGHWDREDFIVGPKQLMEGPPPNTSMTNSFFDPEGEMEVKIFVGKSKLLPGEKLDLEIVFTSYTDCYRYPNSVSCSRGKCIWEGFQCDRFVNCGFDFPVDEPSTCEYPYDEEEEEGTSALVKIILTIVILTNIALLMVFIAFLRRKKKLCWSDRATDIPEDTRTQQRSSRTGLSDGGETGSQAPIALNRVSSHSEEVSPSAPALEDLPPSYESLFPDLVSKT